MCYAETFTKAGAYISVGKRYAFAMGPNGTGTHLGIIRIGGHREAGETPWDCVNREAMEEAKIRLSPIKPPVTLRLSCFHHKMQYTPFNWESKSPPPFLVSGEKGTPITFLYLAETNDMPSPSSETKGIVLLTRQEIWQISNNTITLRRFLNSGGILITSEDFDLDVPLRPGWHMRAFNDLMQLYPGL